MRLGDLDALKEVINKVVDEEMRFEQAWAMGLKYSLKLIDNAPTVEERPQGEWIKEPNGRTTDIYRCSVCKRSIMLCKGADLTNYPFCHCGAEMKGGDSK